MGVESFRGATVARNITPPTVATDATLVGQQWRDADAALLGEQHPLSLNRSSTYLPDPS